jgi:hypothetical protein
MIQLERAFVKDRHVHRFRVRRGEIGWHVREERDATVIHEAHFNDWHRVELAVRLFESTAKALTRDGWTEQADANADTVLLR